MSSENYTLSEINEDVMTFFTIVVVEDDVGLCKLIDRSLKRAGFTTETAHTGEEAILKATTIKNPILLMDYKLDRMSASQIIERIKKIIELPPFLVMTGQGDENIAVNMMKQGAIDYIIKDVNLIEVLSEKVKRACKDVIHNRTLIKMEHELVNAGKQWQTTFDATNDAIFLLDENQIILQCNKISEDILNRSSSEIIGEKCCEVVHGTEYPIEDCPFLKVKESKQRETMEFPYANKILEITLDPILNNAGELTGGVHWIRDITEKREVEITLQKSEDFLKTIYDNSDIAIFVVRVNGIGDYLFEGINRQHELLFGFKNEDVADQPIRFIEKFHGKEFVDYVYSLYDECVTLKKPHEEEYSSKGKNGSVEWWFSRLYPLMNDKGVVYRIIGSAINITERKLAEEKLMESERRLSTLMGNIPGMAYRCHNDPDWTMEFISDGCLDLTGYKPEEIVSNKIISFSDLIHPDDRDFVQSSVQKALNKDKQYELIYQIIRADKKKIWVWEQGKGIKDKNGKLVALEGLITDITDQKKAEKDLSESEERYRSLFETAAEAIIVAEVESKKFVDSNESACDLLGYSYKELMDLSVYDIHPKKELAEVIEIFDAQARGEYVFAEGITCLRKDGKIIYADIKTSPIELNGTKYNVGFFTDTTEKKKAEQAIRDSEEKFSKVFNENPIAISLINLETRSFLDINKSFEQVTGFTRKDVIDKNLDDIKIIVDPEEDKELYEKLREEKIVEKDVIKFRKKEGSMAWGLLRGELLKLGETNCALSMILDITEKIKAEEALKESEERYRLLATNSGDMIYKMSLPEGKYEYVSPASEKLFGYAPEEFDNTQLLIEKVIHPNWYGYFKRQWVKLLRGEMPPAYEYQIIHKSGETRWIHQRNVLLKDEDGNPVGIQGTVSDITERKEFEETLKKRNKELELFNDVTVGRELKMVGLKKEINEMLVKSGDRPKYEIPY